MRWHYVILSLVLVGACGGESRSPTAPTPAPRPPQSSRVLFTLDANSCRGIPPVVIEFFIDGSSVGSGTMAPGQTSQSFPVTAGTHLLSARVANIDYTWPTLTAMAPAGSSFTYLLLCT